MVIKLEDKVDAVKLERSIDIFKKLIEQKDPFGDSGISKDDVINNPKLKLCLEYVIDILEKLRYNKSLKLEKVGLLKFNLTQEQKSNVVFPDYPIGISEFCTYINSLIDTEKMKKLSPIDLNRGLKHMGVLHEIVNPKTNHTKTIVNPDVSLKYGISTISYEKNGITIEKIVYDNTGKNFLLNNLEEILESSKKYKSNN